MSFEMITDEQLEDLPEDNEEAFIQYETIVREFLDENRSNTWAVEREYASHIIAFALNRPIGLELPTTGIPDADTAFALWFERFLRAIDMYKAGASDTNSHAKKAKRLDPNAL